MKAKKETFAKVVLLGQKIHLNSQAMLALLSRSTSGEKLPRERDFQGQINNSLKDLKSCLEEFSELTGIDMSPTLETLDLSFEAFERKDYTGLYEYLQKLYRDDYLRTIIELTR